jgi:hypothetical protein
MNIGTRAKEARYAAGLGLALLAQSSRTDAQTFVLETGGGESLVTKFQMIEGVTEPNSLLHFDVGLATAEELSSGSFFDSVTLSLEGTSPAATTAFTTLDRTGVLWAPSVPGGISLDPNSLTWTEIPFPDVATSLTYRRAYSVTAPIPTEFLGQTLMFRIDLFDNMNGLESVAFVNELSVVPEPSAIGLATALILLGVGFVVNRNRRSQ